MGLMVSNFFRLAKHWNAHSTPIQILLAFPGAPWITLDFKFSTWNNLSSLGDQPYFPRRSRQESLIFTKYVPDVSRKTNTTWPHSPELTKAAAAAKSLQLCPTLCDPIDSSPPGSAVPGILQARTLEWVAISFSNACKSKVKVKSLSHVWLFATPWTAAYQAPLSMGFSRQEYWSGVPFPSPMHESEKWKWSCSVVSDSSRPHGVQSTRLLYPWDFPGKAGLPSSKESTSPWRMNNINTATWSTSPLPTFHLPRAGWESRFHFLINRPGVCLSYRIIPLFGSGKVKGETKGPGKESANPWYKSILLGFFLSFFTGYNKD